MVYIAALARQRESSCNWSSLAILLLAHIDNEPNNARRHLSNGIQDNIKNETKRIIYPLTSGGRR